MDFRKLLQELDTINEADLPTTAIPKEPAIASVQSNKPDMDRGEDIDNVTIHDGPIDFPNNNGATDQQPLGNSENLIKQLYDISTKLQQLNQQSIESWKNESIGNIQYALLESFNLLFEGPEAGQRDALISQATAIIKSLGQFPQDERISDAIAAAQRAMKAPVSPGQMYPVNNYKIKRFQELMAKSNVAPATTPGSSAKSSVPTSASDAQKKNPKYNPQVEKLQQTLLAKGYDLGPRGVDGNLGSYTLAAIEKAKIGGISDADIAKIPYNDSTSSTKHAQLPVEKKPEHSAPPKKPDAGSSSMAQQPKMNGDATAATPKPHTSGNKILTINSPVNDLYDAFNTLTPAEQVKLKQEMQDVISPYWFNNFGLGDKTEFVSPGIDEFVKKVFSTQNQGQSGSNAAKKIAIAYLNHR